MSKIAFLGAGSTVFAKNVLGDCLCAQPFADAQIALYDIDARRLEESRLMLDALNRNLTGGKAQISCHLGVENRRSALAGADFVVNAIQVGGYEPCTVYDFEIPKKYGLRQTIGDTLGIGGIMRGLRTIPVMEGFARDMEDVCPDALLLNYTNPMSILTGYMLRYTGVKTVGLCHSVQVCSEDLLQSLGMANEVDGRRELIAGINHMGWLLELRSADGRDLYPEVRRRAALKNATMRHHDMVRFEYIRRLGYYCTESSEHNAEYNPFFIKARCPGLVESYNIPLDEYPRRCVRQIARWEQQRKTLVADPHIEHTRSHEYASRIMEAMITDVPYKIGGNVLNCGLIDNLPADACVEVPCMVDGRGVNPCRVGRLPVQLAAMNMTHINVHLLTIDAAVTHSRDRVYQAAMLDPHTAAELTTDEIAAMCDELLEAERDYLPTYK